jgi:wyosine [tRNA(Phe)-imidazoG37] synthetase (radical SAM superfamily)
VNCEILRTLYVRANGDVVCNDDAGERVLLGKIPPHRENWTIESLLTNHRYRHIRAALASGRGRWSHLCANCAFFRPHEAFTDPLADKCLRKVQIEPSLACRLRCPSCSNHVQVHVRPDPLQMEVALFERLLARLAREGYTIVDLEYCGQGEPLLHPDFPEFVRLTRHFFPATVQRLITSGNFDYTAATGRERLDEIIVSCDGARPESYRRYRVGGSLERALQFMRHARAEKSPRPQLLIWKYILFEWNDSPAELEQAQVLAQAIGVDWLLFVFTHSAGKSRRYTIENAAEFPRRFANVTLNATPLHYQQGDPLARASA